MRRTIILLAAASATLLLGAACSSSKGAATTTAKPADTAAATTPLDTASSDTASPDTSSASTVDTTPIVATGPHKDEPFCVAAVSFNNAPSPFNDPKATSDDFKKFFAEIVTPGVAAMRANEPSEVKADVDTVANGFEKLGQVFEANNWDLEKTSQDSELASLLGSQAFGDATSNLDQYCGFGS